ncbi:hypothetical protein M9Y10_038953 [Tritrichomonas musculus]|uniref:Uncharacterized protein n=1 Tax=Tritrichomonas musculus TaxID=1915356 RepID=A0ABR2K9V0_9EUKA
MESVEIDQSIHLDAEEIAEVILKEMIESGKWERIRVNLASILNVNRDYEKVKERAQEMLSTDQMKQRMKRTTITEYDIAATIEQQGGLEQYRNALMNLLNTDNPTGREIQQEIYDMVENYVLKQQT